MQRDRTVKKSNTRLEQAMRISRSVKTQYYIVSTLVVSAILALILGTSFKLETHVQAFFLGLSGNLIVAVIIFLFLEQGIKSLHPISEIRNLPASEFIENMSRIKAGACIRILETFTSLTNEHQAEFAAAVKATLRSGIKIEVLLFHPYSEGAMKRAQQLQGQADVMDELRKNLARLYDLQSEMEYQSRANLEVKLYSALPSIAMYRWGEWAYVSLFPVGKRGDRCPNLKVPMDNPFGSYVDDTFEELWVGTIEAPTIPLDLHMRLRIEPATPIPTHADPGHYFAYHEVDGQVDRSKCFVLEHVHTFFFSIYEKVKEKDKVIFYVDGKKWQAAPHLLNARDSLELDEFLHALRLVERRYEWPEGKLGGNPMIIRFKDIEEVIDADITP
jgi:hypothetical protein